MAQSDEPKKVIEINWFSLAIIAALAGVAIFFGVRSSRLSAKDEQNIVQQTILTLQRDSLSAQALRLETRVKVLEAGVQDANKNTANAERLTTNYKSKYLALKNQTPPNPCDTFPILEECDKQVALYENYVLVLKANVMSYSRLTDTLKLENRYLLDANKISANLVENQKQELSVTRNKLRRGKILNWGLSGLTAGAIIILFVK